MALTPPAEPPNRPARRRAGTSLHHTAARICPAARRKGHGGKMTRTKSRRRFPSDGCPGPLGDPLVCAPFLDDGMIRVQLNQASSQRIESAWQPRRLRSLSPCGVRGERSSLSRSGRGSTSRARSRVPKPHLDEMHGPESPPYRLRRPDQLSKFIEGRRNLGTSSSIVGLNFSSKNVSDR